MTESQQTWPEKFAAEKRRADAADVEVRRLKEVLQGFDVVDTRAAEREATIAILETRCADLLATVEKLESMLADASTSAYELAERYMRARLQDDDAADLIMHVFREG